MTQIVPWPALDVALAGGLLLKFGRLGAPHFRLFKVSPDCQHLYWHSKKKGRDESRVLLRGSGVQLVVGQTTTVFSRADREDLADKSFSIILGQNKSKTLDVACKNRTEYDSWTEALGYLIEHGPPAESDIIRHAAERVAPADPGSPAGEGQRLLRDKLKESSDVYAFGFGGWGQLGLGGSGPSRGVPTIVEALLGKAIRHIACGVDHCIALSDDGEVFAWGNGGSGRLGTGSAAHEQRPSLLCVSKGEPWIFASVACGAFHSLAVTDGGELYSWGAGSEGQLGHGDLLDQVSPRRVECTDLGTVEMVAANFATTIALNSEMAVFTWGSNDTGCLGTGTTDVANVSVPGPVPALQNTPIVEVAAGGFVMAALDEERQLFTWGWGGAGALGHGTFKDCAEPTRVSALSGGDIRSQQ